MKHLPFPLSILSLALLSACGGGSSDSAGTGGSAGPGESSFSLAVTDGPVDTAQEVVIQFTGIELRQEDGEPISFNFDEPVSIDLLTLQGNDSELLLEGETIPAGDYNQIRLAVNAEYDNVMDSYIILEDGTQHEIWIPSGAQNGLRLVSGFTAASGGNVDFTVDFELKKSITNPPGQPGVIMRPVLRLIDNIEAGSISGIVDNTLVAEACENAAENDGAVYVYAGEVDTATDISGADSDPLTTALVSEAGGEYSYEVGFLAEGDYSLAYTCQNEADDAEAEDSLEFFGLTTLPVVANENTEHNFEFTVQATE